MSETIYREFVIRDEGVMRSLWQFFKLNARAFMERNNPLLVVVTNDEKKRNNMQNRRYWKAVVTPIAEQVWVGGRKFSREAWHELFANKYCPLVEFPLPDGTIHRRRKSTSELTVREFSEYMQAVEAEAASEYGVIFYAGEAA
ncbi:recombination protein NinB [Crenobacter cavernae]|uniref:Recombinase n=1 Tax=Crenobacter cavernae TaxID=2290923 RepID=A0ABY0FDJ5_9NEIS|nr:recombination protein NinB [Crenobacter cavernae]RXZ42688.1 recombinase [Crenobacter cavernae]